MTSSTTGDPNPPPSEPIHNNKTDVKEAKPELEARETDVKEAKTELEIKETDVKEAKTKLEIKETDVKEAKTELEAKESDVKEAKTELEIKETDEKSSNEVVKNLPPNLSSLNINGRPRFEIVTVRENGRLRMFMEPNTSPQLVRSPVKEKGRLQMSLLMDDQQLRGGKRAAESSVRKSI